MTKKQENLIYLSTWFICDNCGVKKFVREGKYIINNSSLCIDCMEAMEDELTKSDILDTFKEIE